MILWFYLVKIQASQERERRLERRSNPVRVFYLLVGLLYVCLPFVSRIILLCTPCTWRVEQKNKLLTCNKRVILYNFNMSKELEKSKTNAQRIPDF